MMTTDDFLSVIATAKTRTDVVQSYAACLPRWEGVRKLTVDAAIQQRWSESGLKWIRQQAWKIRDRQVLGR